MRRRSGDQGGDLPGSRSRPGLVGPGQPLTGQVPRRCPASAARRNAPTAAMMAGEIKNEVASAELDLHHHLFGIRMGQPGKALRDGIVALRTAVFLLPCDPRRHAGGRSDSSPGPAAASTPSRTWCWPIGGATTTSVTCSRPLHVIAWAHRNQRHGTALTSLATASRWC